jgi:sulfur carrier protein
MEIIINNKKKELDAYSTITVQQLLNIQIPEKQKGIAIAINNNIVSKAEWATKIITNNDNILIIKATQGG